jgi:hypothetical protein
MDDLVTWLRAQLDDDEREWLPLVVGPTQTGNPVGRRMLAEVDADRRILDLYEQTEFGDFARRTALEEVIRVRALPRAERPGYRDEWAPDA